MKSLEGQIVWISGASGGIGSAIAIHLAELGAKVAVCFQHSLSRAEEIVRRCRESGGQAEAFRLDVKQAESVRNCYQQICWTLGVPTTMIHAAGGTQIGLLQDVTMQQYDELMDTHVRGAVQMIQSAIPSMIQQKQGRIILLSSIWGETGGAGEAIYSAAKGAIQGLAKSLSKELARSHITVNAVAPGAIETPLLSAQLSDEEQAELAEAIPMGRLGKPEEVARLIGHLCDPESGYITGQVIHVNGGWYT
ncbi:elongation factor P 5-aminopentanone reductase [Thermoactinomyces sp. DSM 45892]|uniref:elongation factor P 5-aminopentanone reductase n=1 Tax=Thermoactinomyces sp. DSM 45892 TaxID=1882753 RepID=UPI00089993A6|nr:SDR family NAD(P)-dependent oxidoreductase [Thermoactinomyces sp. DSM 45892]SDY48726.1 3-oxoacyl-[acyl-carrier protein] reductase [Thermoactinomyces sp. DSM 45892]